MRADIIQTRERLGLSQKEAAEHLGITQGYLSRVEAGVHSPRKHLEAAIQKWIAKNSKATDAAIGCGSK